MPILPWKTLVFESINDSGDTHIVSESPGRHCVTLLLSGDSGDVRRQVLGHRGQGAASLSGSLSMGGTLA